MSTRKPKVPADVAALKALVQEQAVTIATLTKERDTALEEKKRHEGYWNGARKEADEFKQQIEEIHALVDACPGAIARWIKTPKRNEWDIEKERENSIMVRLASFMGAFNAPSRA